MITNSISNVSGGSVGFGLGSAVYETDSNRIFGDLNINLYGPYHTDAGVHTDAGLVAVCNNALEALVGIADRKTIAGGSNVFKALLSISYKADKDGDAARLFSRTLAVVEQLWGNTNYYNNKFEYLYKLGVLAGGLCDDIETYLFNSKSFEFTEGLEQDDQLLDKCSQYIENSCYVYFNEYDGLIGCGFRAAYIRAVAPYFGDVSNSGDAWVPFPETSPEIIDKFDKILNNSDYNYYKLFVFSSGCDEYNIDKILDND